MVVAAVTLFILPSSFAQAPTAGNALPVAPHAVPGHVQSVAKVEAKVVAPRSAPGLPGSDPRGLATIDGPALAVSAMGSMLAAGENFTQIAATVRAQVNPSDHPATSTTTTPAPLPAASTGPPTGTVKGYVYNYNGTALQGVAVQVYSATGASSVSQKTCPSVSTALDGSFTACGPVGADYATFTYNYYLENLTYFKLYQGVTTTLNYTVYLVHDAYAIGTVYSNNTHKALSGISVSAISRDQTQIGIPGATTGSSGYFMIALPPLPSIITFSPPFGCLSTFRYANATPWGTVNLGSIYLECEITVRATLYDAVTGTTVPSGSCGPFPGAKCNALKVCSSVTNVCYTQGPSVGGASVAALGLRGDDYVIAYSTGYEINSVPVGYLNASTNVGAIYMIPIGGVSLQVQVTHNSTPLPPWALGMYIATVCSLNGLSAGQITVNPATFTVNMTSSSCLGGCSVTSTGFTALPAIPLRNVITVAPDTTGVCNPPIPQWPIPGDLPVWGNTTWANVTPDTSTVAYANLTPGNYVYGNVTVPGLTPGTFIAPNGGFTVAGLSTDNPTLTSYAYNSLLSPWNCAPYPKTSMGFCAPVPPGPGELRAQSLTQNYSDNYTWGSTPYMCCYHGYEPMTMNAYSGGPPGALGFRSINMTQVGAVYGRVFQGGTNLAVFFGSIKVSAAGNHPLSPSFDGAVYNNGSFYSQAPLGWVAVQASASGFSPNTVWAWVNGSTNVGNISMTPLATVQGRIIDPQGNGIYEANVKYCHVDSPNGCTTLGAGLSQSDGGFNGTMLGGWLPWTTYEIQVTSAGYTTDFTWFNATAGGWTVLPPITLYPLGVNSTGGAMPAHHAGVSSTAAGVWIDGTLLDSVHGTGIQTGGIQACPIDGSPCSLFTDGSNTQGYFNSSVTPGLYNLTVASAGYGPLSLFFNASQASFVHLGEVEMQLLPWVSGHANMTPYGFVSVKHGSVYARILMAPGATAFACSNNGSVCGTSLVISSQGAYRVQTAGGVYNKIQITPNGGTLSTSSNGGFVTNTTSFNSTSYQTNLTGNITLDIYALVGGYVMDNSTVGPLDLKPWLPARFTPFGFSTFGPAHAALAGTTNGGGYWLAFVPPGPTTGFEQAGLSPEATIPANHSVTFASALSNAVPPTVALVPQLNLTHFGWVVIQVNSEPNNTAASYVGISLSFNDPVYGALSSSGVTSGSGYANITAPPGDAVKVQVGPGNDFNGTNFTVSVNSSRTTYINGTDLLQMGLTLIPAWGWVRSLGLNNTSAYQLPTVVDKANGRALPLADISVTSQDPAYQGTSLQSNWAGQFLSDAPIGLRDTLSVTHWAYVVNQSLVNVVAGQVVGKPTINMTGVGILAGELLQFPGYTPIPFASIQTCPYNSTGFSNCYSASTNASGGFWVAAFPGLVTVTATANGFVSNTTTVARSCADCWNRISPIILNEFSYVYGTVRGLPSGLPIAGATVSACSPLGSPTGPCGFQVNTNPTGNFLLAIPSGNYILQAWNLGYNASYLPVSLVPGEILPVGLFFLKQYGQITGAVLSSTTYLPVYNVSVFGCPEWQGTPCTPSSHTDASGQYTIAGPPGPYTIAAIANGYADAYSKATIVSGGRGTIAPILVTPLGTNVFYLVSGEVVNSSDPTQPIAGAVVSLNVNGTPAFSVRTSVSGAFALNALYGTYTLLVSDAGYLPSYQKVTVHAPVSGLLIPLSVMTYNVTGTVTDGLTHQDLTGVAITQGNVVLAVSDVNGQFAFALPNGTQPLLATYEGGGTVDYAPVSFSVGINGAGVDHPIQMFPPSAMITGVVADADAGTPLGGATVTLSGTTADGVPVTQTVTSNPQGGFTVTLPVGSYTASTGYTGYTAGSVSFSVTPAGQQVPLLLKPISTPTSTVAPSGFNATLALLGSLMVVVVAMVVLGLIVWGRTRPKSPAKPVARAKPANPPKGGSR